MNKLLVLVCSLIICFTSLACSCNKDETIVLEDAQYTDGEGNIVYFEKFDPIQEKRDQKANFVFYMFGATCPVCANFSKILKEYAKEQGIIVYAVEIEDVENYDRDLQLALGCTPAVAIFKDGVTL